MLELLGHVAFGLFGLAALLGIAVAFSNHRRAIDRRLVATGLVLQIGFAAFVLKAPLGRELFDGLAGGFVSLLGYAKVGSSFIFGSLVESKELGFIFAVQVLPTIVFFAALTGVLYHLGVMQRIVSGMAWAITRVMKVSGAETTSVCASVFVGQTEAPLTIKPYIERMTESELMTVMIGGMAHIAGSVMAAYIGLLGGGDPLASAGLPPAAAQAILNRMIDQQAYKMAVTDLFLLSSLLFIGLLALVWSSRPAPARASPDLSIVPTTRCVCVIGDVQVQDEPRPWTDEPVLPEMGRNAVCDRHIRVTVSGKARRNCAPPAPQARGSAAGNPPRRPSSA